MVYLVWFRCPGRNETLLGVWPTEGDARKHCELVARSNACGSGFITESLMGNSWEVRTPQRDVIVVRYDEVPFGMVQ